MRSATHSPVPFARTRPVITTAPRAVQPGDVRFPLALSLSFQIIRNHPGSRRPPQEPGCFLSAPRVAPKDAFSITRDMSQRRGE